MSIQEQIEAFESLAAIDLELAELRSQLEGSQAELTGKRGQLQELQERVQRTQESLVEMERMKGELVGEVRQTSLQVDRSREKLARCRTEREANAGQRELEELRKIQRDREIEIEKINALISQARTDVEQLAGQRDALGEDLGSREGEASNRFGGLDSGIKEREAKRQELAGRVPPALFRKYETIRKRKGTAIAHTTNGTCSACNMAMPPMMFQNLLRVDEFQTCPHCNRLIYFKAPVGDDAARREAGDNAGSNA